MELGGGVTWLRNIDGEKRVVTLGISALTAIFGLRAIMIFVTLGQILTFVTIAKPKKKRASVVNISGHLPKQLQIGMWLSSLQNINLAGN